MDLTYMSDSNKRRRSNSFFATYYKTRKKKKKKTYIVASLIFCSASRAADEDTKTGSVGSIEQIEAVWRSRSLSLWRLLVNASFLISLSVQFTIDCCCCWGWWLLLVDGCLLILLTITAALDAAVTAMDRLARSGSCRTISAIGRVGETVEINIIFLLLLNYKN